MSQTAKNLLEGLLRKDPEKRLGGGSDGASAIKDHPFFSNINWDAMIRKEYEAPFVPKITSDLDLSNFDPEFTSVPINSWSDSTEIGKFKHYDSFTWEGSNIPSNGSIEMEIEN